MQDSTSSLWWRDSNKTAAGKTGAVRFGHGLIRGVGSRWTILAGFTSSGRDANNEKIELRLEALTEVTHV